MSVRDLSFSFLHAIICLSSRIQIDDLQLCDKLLLLLCSHYWLLLLAAPPMLSLLVLTYSCSSYVVITNCLLLLVAPPMLSLLVVNQLAPTGKRVKGALVSRASRANVVTAPVQSEGPVACFRNWVAVVKRRGHKSCFYFVSIYIGSEPPEAVMVNEYPVLCLTNRDADHSLYSDIWAPT